MASGFRPDFVEALGLLALAIEKLRLSGEALPILVGGAAVEFYTGGAVTTGDFDLVAPDQAAIENALVEVGFRREDRPGRIMRGLYHSRSNFGVEVVSGRFFDGLADPNSVVEVKVSDFRIRIAAIEDMIADRLGQYAGNPRGSDDMLDQAIKLWQFAPKAEIDETYLDRRIREETAGDLSLADLKSKA